jgi:hypothetical protein
MKAKANVGMSSARHSDPLHEGVYYMLPTRAVRLQLGELLAADDTTLAPAADANKVKLVIEAFVPDEDLTVDDFVLAAFTGSTPLACGVGTQPAGVDPDTGDQVVTLKSPAGGWRWECTADPAEPENVFGAILTNLAGDELLGMMLLPAPIAISEAGQEVNLGVINMRLVAQPIS